MRLEPKTDLKIATVIATPTPQGAAAGDIYSTEFIASSTVLWREYNPEIEMNQDSVKEMVGNLSGFFDLLKSWSEKDISDTKKD